MNLLPKLSLSLYKLYVMLWDQVVDILKYLYMHFVFTYSINMIKSRLQESPNIFFPVEKGLYDKKSLCEGVFCF